jgi:hypothetical protein
MRQKTIAVIVTIAFFSILNVAAFPLRAQEAPGAVEKAGPATVQPGGGSILPIVLIGVGVLAIAAVLIFVVFKTSYDITGNWTISFAGTTAVIWTTTFSGSKASGTWQVTHTTFATPAQPSGNDRPVNPRSLVVLPSGTYTVNGDAVTMTVTNSLNVTFTGRFDSADTMSGTWSNNTASVNWSATRSAN